MWWRCKWWTREGHQEVSSSFGLLLLAGSAVRSRVICLLASLARRQRIESSLWRMDIIVNRQRERADRGIADRVNRNSRTINVTRAEAELYGVVRKSSKKKILLLLLLSSTPSTLLHSTKSSSPLQHAKSPSQAPISLPPPSYSQPAPTFSSHFHPWPTDFPPSPSTPSLPSSPYSELLAPPSRSPP